MFIYLKYFQGFVRKKYLEIETESSSDPPIVMYKWGERAHAEFSKKQMLDLVCKVSFHT